MQAVWLDAALRRHWRLQGVFARGIAAAPAEVLAHAEGCERGEAVKSFRWDIAAYALEAAHLDPMEDLAYRRLLDLYCLTEAPLTVGAARRVRVDGDIVQRVLDEFFDATPEGYRHTRLDEQVRDSKLKLRAYRKNGKRGGRPVKTSAKTRLVSESDVAHESAHESENQTLEIQNQGGFENPAKVKKSKPNANQDESDGFTEFWEAYRHKLARPDAMKAWAALPANVDRALVIEKAKAVANHFEGEKQYQPYPATWLRREGWNEPLVRRTGGARSNDRPDRQRVPPTGRVWTEGATVEPTKEDLAAFDNGLLFGAES